MLRRQSFFTEPLPLRSSNLVFFPPAPHTLKGEGRFFCEEETEGMGEGFMHGCCGRGAGRRGIFGSGEISSAEAVFADHRWGCAADFCKGWCRRLAKSVHRRRHENRCESCCAHRRKQRTGTVCTKREKTPAASIGHQSDDAAFIAGCLRQGKNRHGTTR